VVFHIPKELERHSQEKYCGPTAIAIIRAIRGYEEGAMKKHCCSECGGKLGLGVRFRNLWNGFNWFHLRFCSARCEERNEYTRRSTNREERWYSYASK